MHLGVVLLATQVSSDNPQNITRVEEDWRITFVTPDPNLNAPQ